MHKWISLQPQIWNHVLDNVDDHEDRTDNRLSSKSTVFVVTYGIMEWCAVVPWSDQVIKIHWHLFHLIKATWYTLPLP